MGQRAQQFLKWITEKLTGRRRCRTTKTTAPGRPEGRPMSREQINKEVDRAIR